MVDDRYCRQTMLDQIGPEGQRRLACSSVAVVGAGGLGSPALTYLAAAGIGRLGLIDPGAVSLSNLNRQFLHGESDIGRPKTASAEEKLAALNSGIAIIPLQERLTDGNAKAVLAGFDLVLGAADSFEARFVINRASVALGLPYIDGGVGGFGGYVMFSQPKITPCLRCVFPDRAPKKKPTGVLGAAAGVVGALEANLALLWLLHGRNPIENQLLLYDGLRMRFDLVGIKRGENCPVCGEGTI